MSDPNSRLLLQVALVVALFPNVPRPLLAISGPQGSGKTSACRYVVDLLDPGEPSVSALPTRIEDLVLVLSQHHTVCFGNLPAIDPEISDVLCRACTGGGIQRRRLYRDNELITLSVKRQLIVNGIASLGARPDLLDRTLGVVLDRIASQERRLEAELDAEFAACRPALVGAIMAVAARAMEILPTLHLTSRLRLADFHQWGLSAALALGYTEADFNAAFGANLRWRTGEALSSSVVAGVVESFMQGRTEVAFTPSDLYTQLRDHAEASRINTRDRSWPQSAHWLTLRLRQDRQTLAEIGLHVEEHRGTHRLISISRQEPVCELPPTDANAQTPTHGAG